VPAHGEEVLETREYTTDTDKLKGAKPVTEATARNRGPASILYLWLVSLVCRPRLCPQNISHLGFRAIRFITS
jgi:hypothetical protein